MRYLWIVFTWMLTTTFLSVFCFGKNIVCFYDSNSYLRPGLAKLSPANLEVALSICTHLVYGYAILNPISQEVHSHNVDLDMFHYSEISLLKFKYPHLKVFLSIGGDRDITDVAEYPMKYIKLLESGRPGQRHFIDSSISLLRSNGFDGLDLAFQLPRNKPRKVHTAIGTYWKQFKKIFTGDFIVDKDAEVHKRMYTEFVINLKTAFARTNLSLSMTVLPNVNSSWYFDVPQIKNSFDFINLAVFDFLTPDRNPEEADYTAPIHSINEQNRLLHYSVDFQVNYWLKNHCPSEKLHLGVSSSGRAWKMTPESGLTGIPVVRNTMGPAQAGSFTNTSGSLSWPEICSILPNSRNTQFVKNASPLRKVTDITQRYGNYAFRSADISGDNGIWVSYDDPDFVGVKTSYAKEKGLGGMALFDLSNDDFQGSCTGLQYPILRAIKYFL